MSSDLHIHANKWAKSEKKSMQVQLKVIALEETNIIRSQKRQ